MDAHDKVALLVCGGIGRIVSTVVRRAAYMVVADRPAQVVLISSGALTGNVPEALDAARSYPLIVVDACAELCASAIVKGKGLQATDTIWLRDTIAKHKLSLADEDRKGLGERGMKLARTLADEIIERVDAVIENREDE